MIDESRGFVLRRLCSVPESPEVDFEGLSSFRSGWLS
jgi:hypothetical protein